MFPIEASVKFAVYPLRSNHSSSSNVALALLYAWLTGGHIYWDSEERNSINKAALDRHGIKSNPLLSTEVIYTRTSVDLGLYAEVIQWHADISCLKEHDLLMATGRAVGEEQDFAFTGEREDMSDSCRRSTGHTRQRACSSADFWVPGVHTPPEEGLCFAALNAQTYAH